MKPNLFLLRVSQARSNYCRPTYALPNTMILGKVEVKKLKKACGRYYNFIGKKRKAKKNQLPFSIFGMEIIPTNKKSYFRIGHTTDKL